MIDLNVVYSTPNYTRYTCPNQPYYKPIIPSQAHLDAGVPVENDTVPYYGFFRGIWNSDKPVIFDRRAGKQNLESKYTSYTTTAGSFQPKTKYRTYNTIGGNSIPFEIVCSCSRPSMNRK